MREVIREMIEHAQRSGDRIGVDGTPVRSALLAAETIRLARVATSIHLADSARRTAAAGRSRDRVSSTREPAQ